MEDEVKNEEEKALVTASEKLEQQTQQIVDDLVDAKTVDEAKDLTELFNLSQRKMDALHLLKLSKVRDTALSQMEERLEKRPHEFTNKDLMDYMNSFEKAIERAQGNVAQVRETPAITHLEQNNTTININDNLTRDEKRNIVEAVKSILKGCQPSETKIIDVPEEDINSANQNQQQEDKKDNG